MTRLFGYILCAVSGFAFLISVSVLVFQILASAENSLSLKDDSSYPYFIFWLSFITTFSFLVIFYTIKTGFGKSKLENAQEELEVLKIKQEIQKLTGK